MANDYIREAGRIEDFDGRPLLVVVDYDTIVIGETAMTSGYRLSMDQAEEFASLFVAACWQAGRNAERMSAEAVADADQE